MDKNKRVYVYFNLHKKVWSVRQSGKVIEHTKHIKLRDCRFLVSQAGRKKARLEKKKNVHAGVSGYVINSIPEYRIFSEAKITYSPYRHKGFVAVNDPYETVERSDFAELQCGEGWRDVWACWTVDYPINLKGAKND